MSANVINQIKVLLGLEVKLEQMTLENGTVLEADAFEAGASVFIVGTDGNIPLPVGEYALDNGQILVVEEEGIIAAIKDVQGEEVPEAEVPAEAAPAPAEETQMQGEIVTLEMVKQLILDTLTELGLVTPAEAAPVAEAPVEAPVVEETQMAAAKPIKANPEKESSKKNEIKFSTKKLRTTEDIVFEKISKIKKSPK
jgi:hypothetical protein